MAGTAIAWTLVRDRFPGQGFVNALVDLPFALPTIVAGLTLLALYGPNSPSGVNVAFTRWAILVALLFVTLPFVVRTVQPVLLELDREMEDAAASLGAGASRRSGASSCRTSSRRSFRASRSRSRARSASSARVVLISGNLPFKTEVVSVYVFGRIESGDAGRRGCRVRRHPRDLVRASCS